MFALRRACHRPCQKWHRMVSTVPPLPPLQEWKSKFPLQGFPHRVTLKNPAIADELANAFFADEEQPDTGGFSSDGKIVIEAFPGPGCLTRSLMKLPSSKVKKLIVLEDAPIYMSSLTPLEAADPRVTVIPLSGFDWSTYTELEARGLLDDVVTKSWKEGLPNLHFVAHVPNSVLGEQLTNQFFRHIPERSWLFKYGRVPMSLLLSDHSYRRITATNKSQEFCKLSVIANAVSSVREAIPRQDLQPYKDYFHPVGLGSETKERRGTYRPPGSPYDALQVTPLPDPVIEKGQLDKWDYVLRKLFVLKTTPIKRAITSLGPGALNLLKILGDKELPPGKRVDTNKKVRELEMREWRRIIQVFDEWPFRPEDLQISDAIYKDVERDR